MTFDMGSETLSLLTRQTSGAHDDLGALVRQFVDAALALDGRYNGLGREAFESFKREADAVADELNLALAAMRDGIDGQNVAFTTGEHQMSDETHSLHAGSDFVGARFRGQA